MPNLPSPSIISVSANPVNASAGLTVTGTGFSSTAENNRVLFSTASGFVRVTPSSATTTTLTVTVPAAVASGPIQVIRADCGVVGESFPLLVNGSSTPLTITSVSPSYLVPTGALLTLAGTGFGASPDDNAVTFRGSLGPIPGEVTAASPTSLGVRVPDGAQCGVIAVSTGGKISNSVPVVIAGTACALTLSEVVGGGAPGEVIALKGTGFDRLTPAQDVVTFRTAGGTAVGTVVQSGSTRLHVRVPDDAIDGDVTIRVGVQTSNAVPYKRP